MIRLSGITTRVGSRPGALAASAVLLAACAASPRESDTMQDPAPAAGAAAAAAGATNSTPAAAKPGADGWTALFDGTDLRAWRGYRSERPPASWRVQDGTLAFVKDSAGRGDLVSREQYGDFELELEWRISPGGNSGIFYRGTEEGRSIYETAPEMQVLDNTRHVDGRNPLTSAGANYALHAPVRDVTRPVGEWNQVRLVARGPHVEHWLNGVKVVEYEQGSADWQARVAASKFAPLPGYGRQLRGHIVLQDHDDAVWYRNVRVRRLDAPAPAR